MKSTKNGQVRPETKQRITRWREFAASTATKFPNSSQIQIARAIQRSRLGKRKGGVLPYSISTILKHLRTG